MLIISKLETDELFIIEHFQLSGLRIITEDL